jgi:hypothetical protein
MALVIYTANPAELLAAIKKSIDEKQVENWSYDSDSDFAHTPDLCEFQAWLRPAVDQETLKFGILGKKDVPMTPLIYGVYFSKFAELLFTHFNNDFSLIQIDSFK